MKQALGEAFIADKNLSLETLPPPHQLTRDTIFGDLLRAFCYACHLLAKSTKTPSKENPLATGDEDNTHPSAHSGTVSRSTPVERSHRL